MTAARSVAGLRAGVVVLCLAQVPAAVGARGAAELVAAGNASLEQGLVSQAISHYEEAGSKPGASAVALFNMGVALVRQENYPAALTAFQSIVRPEPGLAPLVHYNQGNALARVGQMLLSEDVEAAAEMYARSLAAYQRALSLDPHYSPAAANLEIVRTWIAQLAGEASGGEAEKGSGQDDAGSTDPGRQAPAPGDDGGGGSGQSPSPDAPQPPPQEPGASGSADNPWAHRDETAQGILEEERRRREEEAAWSGGGSSDGKPDW